MRCAGGDSGSASSRDSRTSPVLRDQTKVDAQSVITDLVRLLEAHGFHELTADRSDRDSLLVVE